MILCCFARICQRIITKWILNTCSKQQLLFCFFSAPFHTGDGNNSSTVDIENIHKQGVFFCPTNAAHLRVRLLTRLCPWWTVQPTACQGSSFLTCSKWYRIFGVANCLFPGEASFLQTKLAETSSIAPYLWFKWFFPSTPKLTPGHTATTDCVNWGSKNTSADYEHRRQTPNFLRDVFGRLAHDQGDAEFLPIRRSSGCWTRLFKLYIIGLPPTQWQSQMKVWKDSLSKR